MPNLKFKITGDESELRKSLARVKKELSEQAKKDLDNALNSAKAVSDSEKKKRQEISETTKEIEKQSQVRRKTILSDSQAEVEAYRRSKTGDPTIKGSLTNTSDQGRATLANAATAVSTAQNKVAESTSKANQKLSEQITALNSIKLRMESYKRIAESSTDHRRLSEYNRKIQETQIEIDRMSNVGKQGFDAMGNKIKSNTNLAGKLWGGLKTVANILPGLGVAGILAFAIEPLMNYIKGLDLFTTKAQRLEEINKEVGKAMGQAGVATAKANIEIETLKNRIDAAKKGLVDKKSALREYNESVGKTVGYANSLNEAESKIIKNGQAYVELMFKKAKAAAMMQVYTEKMAKAAQELAKTDEESVSWKYSGYLNSPTKQIQDIAKKDAEKNRKEAYNKQIKDLENIKSAILEEDKQLISFASKNRLNVYGDDDKNKRDALSDDKKILEARNRRLDFEKRITDLKDKYNRKSLIKDDSEEQAIRDEFKRIAFEIKQFNDNPKNKIKINGSGLDEIREKAITDLKYGQDTEKLKIELDKQKQFFEDYEDYKTKFGKQAADERFKEDLKGAESYFQYVQKLQEKNDTAFKAVDNKKATANQEERVKLIKKQYEEAARAEQTALNKVLQDTLTIEEKKLKAKEQYEEDVKKLAEKGKADNIAIRTEQYNQEVADLEQQGLEKLDFFKKLFGDIELVTVKGLKQAVVEANDQLAKYGTDPRFKKQADQIKSKLNEVQKKLADRLPNGLAEVGTTFNQLADDVKDFDNNLSNSLSTLGKMATQASKVSAGINAAEKGFAKGGDILSGITGAVGAIGAAVAAMSVIKDLVGSKARREQEQRQAEEQASLERTKKSIDDLTAALDRQAKQLDRAFGVDKIDLFRNQINLAKGDIQRTINAINKIVDDDQNRQHARGSVILGAQNKLNNLNSAAKGREGRGGVAGVVEDLSTLEKVIDSNKSKINSLYNLLEKGGLNSATEQELRAQLQLYDELEGKLYDYENRLREVLTGTNANSLTDMIADAFRNDSSAEDYAKNFKKLMQDAVIQSLKLTALEGPLKEFYERFAKTTEGGLTAEKIAELRKEYDAIINNAKKEFDTLKQVTGIDFSGSDSTKQGELTKGIQSLTESTGGRIEGELGGLRLAQLQHLEVAKSNSLTLAKQADMADRSLTQLIAIQNNTYVTSQNTGELFAIRAAMESMNNKMSNGDAIRRGAGI